MVGVALTLTVAATLMGVGGWGYWERHQATTASSGTSDESPFRRSGGGSNYDETPVPVSRCQAGSDQPRVIRMKSIGVEGCIQQVGTTGRKLDAPGNIHVAGWFTGSALPGSDGLSIIDGHSSGRFKDGIFNNLPNLKPGSQFTVEYGNGEERQFEVTSVASHSVADAMKELRLGAVAENSNLALITCSGTYNEKTHTYDNRAVVLARNVVRAGNAT